MFHFSDIKQGNARISSRENKIQLIFKLDRNTESLKSGEHAGRKAGLPRSLCSFSSAHTEPWARGGWKGPRGEAHTCPGGKSTNGPHRPELRPHCGGSFLKTHAFHVRSGPTVGGRPGEPGAARARPGRGRVEGSAVIQPRCCSLPTNERAPSEVVLVPAHRGAGTGTGWPPGRGNPAGSRACWWGRGNCSLARISRFPAPSSILGRAWLP